MEKRKIPAMLLSRTVPRRSGFKGGEKKPNPPKKITPGGCVEALGRGRGGGGPSLSVGTRLRFYKKKGQGLVKGVIKLIKSVT